MDQAAIDRLNGESTPALGETRRLSFHFASEIDEAELRHLLSETPIPGWVTLSYEREPDYFRGAAVEGDVHQTLIGRDRKTGRVEIMAARSIRDAWINGEPARLGYLGQLRQAPTQQSQPWSIIEGYRLIRRLVEQGPATRCHITSIISTNDRARRLLTSRARGLPTYRPLGSFFTLAIPCRRRRSPGDSGLAVIGGTAAHREEIITFLARENARFQFAPRWSFEELWGSVRCPGLSVEDFLLAYRGSRLLGCVAVWDQTPFRQFVVRGYRPWLAVLRPLINGPAGLLRWPRLPPVGAELRQAVLSHLAVSRDEPGVMESLLATALDRAARRGLDLAVVGFGERHGLLGPAREAFRHFGYRSDIYLVHWDDDDSAAGSLDDRPIQLEAAIL